MSTARMYWYPDPVGSLETTDIGDLLSDLQEPDLAIVEDTYAGDGTPYRQHLATTKRVRMIFERFGAPGGNGLERSLKSMEAHLFKGGFFGISADHAKSWAGIATAQPSRGDTVVYTGAGGGNGFTAWSAAAEPAAGDEIVIESAHPDALREVAVCGAVTWHPPLDLPIAAPGCLYTYASNVIARWRDFYPVCFLPKDQVGKPIVYGDHRRNFTLDITFEYCLATTLALWDEEAGPGVLGGGAGLVEGLGLGMNLRGTTGGGGMSLEEMLGRSPRFGPITGWRGVL